MNFKNIFQADVPAVALSNDINFHVTMPSPSGPSSPVNELKKDSPILAKSTESVPLKASCVDDELRKSMG